MRDKTPDSLDTTAAGIVIIEAHVNLVNLHEFLGPLLPEHSGAAGGGDGEKSLASITSRSNSPSQITICGGFLRTTSQP
jgi:hypothetical protein